MLYSSPWGKRLLKSLTKTNLSPKPVHQAKAWNIVRGDKVEVIEGPCASQKGTVLKVIRKQNRVIVDGVNMRRRIVKAMVNGLPNKMVTKPCSVHYSNVMLLDPSLNKPTKVTRRYLEDGSKVRVSRLSGVVIPKPNPLVDRKPRSNVIGTNDTLPKDVFTVTFKDYEKFMSYIYDSKKKK